MAKMNIADLAELTGLNRQTVKTRLGELHYETGHRNSRMYDTREALPLIYKIRTEELDLNAERARLVYHQANKTSLEEAILTGELLRVKDVERVVGGSWMAFRAKVLALPSKVASRLNGSETRQEIEDTVTVLAEEALGELSRFRFEDYVDTDVPKAGPRPGAAAESDDKPVGGRTSKAKSGGKRGAGKVGNGKG